MEEDEYNDIVTYMYKTKMLSTDIF